MKILIIEDNVQLAELIKMDLLKYDYEVSICDDATEGINYVSTYQPNLILIDILMPNLNGPEIVQFLKMDQKFKDIPIVFLACLMTGDENILQGEGLKVDGVKYPILAKPYQSEQLLIMVKQHAKAGNTYLV
jgi:DNA-binding response OmpR family regulator